MTLDELIERLIEIKQTNDLLGETTALIDTGMCLCAISEVDLGASDEGVILWAGDLVEE